MARPPAAAPPRSETRQTLAFFLKLAIVVWLLRSLVFAPFNIPSESMLPRLLIGDYFVLSKWNYGYSRWSLPWGFPAVPGRILARTPDRGDVVVFRGPHGDESDIIKRVIGLPGDTVQMRHGQLILNGKPVPKQRIADFILPLSPNFDGTHCLANFQDADAAGRPVCRYPQYRETLPGGRSYAVIDQGYVPVADDTKVFAVPAGHIFMMGDNRDDSADSRFPAPDDANGQPAGMGFVPLDHVEGKAQVNFFSTDGSAQWIKPWTWVSAARWRRIGEGF